MKKFICLLIIFASVALFAAGDDSLSGKDRGNGGCGFVVNGEYKLFSDIGLEIKSNSEDGELEWFGLDYGYTLPQELMSEVESILASEKLFLPIGTQVSILNALRVISAPKELGGKVRIYKQFNIVDMALYKQFKRTYSATVKDEEAFNELEFALYLSTHKNDDGLVTYIFPDFEKLSLKRKAIVLIHEAIFRLDHISEVIDRVELTKIVLSIENEITKILNEDNGYNSPIKLFLSLKKINLLANPFHKSLEYIMRSRGVNKIKFSEFGDFVYGEAARGYWFEKNIAFFHLHNHSKYFRVFIIPYEDKILALDSEFPGALDLIKGRTISFIVNKRSSFYFNYLTENMSDFVLSNGADIGLYNKSPYEDEDGLVRVVKGSYYISADDGNYFHNYLISHPSLVKNEYVKSEALKCCKAKNYDCEVFQLSLK